jgi:hypothetical protein
VNPAALPNRRRVALRLLLLEAGLLAGILGAFALVSVWRVGTAPLGTLVLLGAALIAPVLAAEWYLVRRDWERIDAGLGGGGRAP